VPELPGIAVYLEALGRYVTGEVLGASTHQSLLVRSVEPPVEALVGQRILGTER
jgi:hypothetical protein